MALRYSRKEIKQLRDRWTAQDSRVEAIMSDIRKGQDWTRHLLASKEAGWDILPFLDNCPSRFWLPGEATVRDLRGLRIADIDLSETQGLADSCLDLCVFEEVLLDSASLRGTWLRQAEFGDDCVLDRAVLQYASLRGADCTGVSFEAADLTGVDLRGANLRDTVLWGTNLRNVRIDAEPWWGFTVPRGWRRWTRFGGEFQSSSFLDSRTSTSIVDYVAGESFKWSFRKQHPALGAFWYVLADYGRSSARLFFWIVAIWILFGIIYAGYPLAHFLEDTGLGRFLCWLSPAVELTGDRARIFDFRPYFASAATMTSAGLENLISDSLSWKAQGYIAIQSFLGNVFLAAFITTLLQNVSYSGHPAGPSHCNEGQPAWVAPPAESGGPRNVEKEPDVATQSTSSLQTNSL